MNVWKFCYAIGLVGCLVLGEAAAQSVDLENPPPGSRPPDEQVGPRPPGSSNPRSWVGANTNPTAQVGNPRPIANQPRPMAGPDSTMPVPMAGGLPGAATWDLCNDPNASNYMALGPCVYSPGPGPGGQCPTGSPTPQQCAAGGANYNPLTCSCVCVAGAVWSGGASGRCVCVNTGLPPVNGQCNTGQCPPGSPTPQECAAAGVAYISSQCTCACPSGTTWSPAYQECVCLNTGLPPINGECNTTQCPPNSPTPEQCQAGGASFNPSECTCSCQFGAVWDNSGNRCVCPGKAVPPNTNGLIGCDCPQGYTWNASLQQCVCSNPPCSCPEGLVANPETQQCVCPGKLVPPNTGGLNSCDCPSGRVWDAQQGRCVCDPSQMPIPPGQCTAGGGTFNENTCSCTCPQGLVWGTDYYTGQPGCLCPGKSVRPGTAGLMHNSCECPIGWEWSDAHRRCVPKCENGFVLNADGTGCDCPSGVVINGTHCCVAGCNGDCGGLHVEIIPDETPYCDHEIWCHSIFRAQCVQQCELTPQGAMCSCSPPPVLPPLPTNPVQIEPGRDCRIRWSNMCGCP